MRGGVAVGLGAVAGAGEDAPVRADDDGADGDLAARGGGSGFVQGVAASGSGSWRNDSGCLRHGGIV